MLPDNVSVAPIQTLKLFVNHCDLLDCGVVRIGEPPPFLKRSLQDIEVSGTYAGNLSYRNSLQFRGAILDYESRLIPQAAHRKTGRASYSRLLDAGQPADTARDFPIKRRALFCHAIRVLRRIVRKRQPYFGSHEPVRFESWAHLKQMQKLRKSRPAPIKSTGERAISEATGSFG
jgi:hypothetical protein